MRTTLRLYRLYLFPERLDEIGKKYQSMRPFCPSSQGGTSKSDVIHAAGSNGSEVVLAGYTWGNWTGTDNVEGWAAVKMDIADGKILWEWQV